MIKNSNPATRIAYWDSRGARGKSIGLQEIRSFNARGMRPVYGRADQFGRLCLYMDMWINSKGRVFVRFWSRNEEVDLYSYEVTGLKTPIDLSMFKNDNEFLVPECLRNEYDNWIVSELPFVWQRKGENHT